MSNDLKTIKFTVRLTQAQYDLLEAHAKSDNKTMSQLARERITLQYEEDEPFEFYG